MKLRVSRVAVPPRAAVGVMVVAPCAIGLMLSGCSLRSGEDGSSEPSLFAPASVTAISLEAEAPSTTTTAPVSESGTEADDLGDEIDELLQGLSDDNDCADTLEDASELD